MRNKILVVDDEPDILMLLRDYLEFNGYNVFTAANGTEALKKTELNPDLILLDINMPDIDGLEVCKKIREYVSCPILFLTARINETDKINGFKVGGDDYVVKPFNMNELAARVAAHIRREQRSNNQATIKFIDELVIHYSNRQITCNDANIAFTKKEFEIIELLTLNMGQVFDKERIYEKIWGYDSDGDSSVVVEHIRRIRQKLLDCVGKTYVETVWGIGYKWGK